MPVKHATLSFASLAYSGTTGYVGQYYAQIADHNHRRHVSVAESHTYSPRKGQTRASRLLRVRPARLSQPWQTLPITGEDTLKPVFHITRNTSRIACLLVASSFAPKCTTRTSSRGTSVAALRQA
ncbi:hypothetical protein BDU57DRAFT_287179 [Ampelomyces quisqualis]|uniref:Uncharacterized protein n=1 Tax=Ampelomyces quisqualis TaxID=50730 RepID=A0A6A5QF04_AMPQU|nr:hypothetical protein BDU57DRAFT_287179 [Ampelomyces quisqualis]